MTSMTTSPPPARPTAPWLVVRVLVALAITAGAWAAVALIDAAVDDVQRDAEAGAPEPPPPAPGEALPTPGRLFVLLVDSLRAPRAESMKMIRELRSKSLFVYVRATQDAATVPSLRAAFTGRRQRSIFAFVRNFGHHGGTTPSLFSQAAARGMRVATFSDGAFYELAPGITIQRSNDFPPGDEETRQVRAFHNAIDLFKANGADVVVFHLTIVDHAAHTRGPGDPVYKHAFEVADELLREADAAVPDEDTLVVFGDHGHDERSRHFPGLDVPTVALYRGPAFKPGAELGPVPLTIHRYLMSWALGMPLAPEYRGVAAPQVLAGPVPPFEYRSPPPEISAALLRGKRFKWLGPLAFLVALIAAAGLWSHAPSRVNARRAVLAAVAVTTLFAAWGAFLAQRRLSNAAADDHGDPAQLGPRHDHRIVGGRHGPAAADHGDVARPRAAGLAALPDGRLGRLGLDHGTGVDHGADAARDRLGAAAIQQTGAARDGRRACRPADAARYRGAAPALFLCRDRRRGVG